MAFQTTTDIQNGEYGQWVYDSKAKKSKFVPMGKAVTIESITSNIETNTVRLLLSFDFMGERKYLEVPHKIIADPAFLHELSDAGADVTKKTFSVFADSLRIQELEMEANQVGVEKVYSKLGWKSHPILTNTGQKNNILCYRAAKMVGGFQAHYTGNLKVEPMGDFSTWKSMVEADVLGHTALEVVLLAGLCAVVNGLISTHTTGENPIFHIMGVSGSGKSTAGLLCASVSGEPFEGERRVYDQFGTPSSQISIYGSWSATENATIARCAGNRGCVVVLNELGKFQCRDMSGIIYNLSEGTDKLRMTKDMSTSLSEGYCTSIVSIGELSLLERCTNKADGLRNRVLELDAPMTTSAVQADRIKSICRRNNGYAAPMLAKYIIRNGGVKAVLELYNTCKVELLQNWPDTPSRERFVSKFPALLLTTSRLASKALGIAFNDDAIIEFLREYDLQHGKERNISASSYDIIIEKCRINAHRFITRYDKSVTGQSAIMKTTVSVPVQDCWGRITNMERDFEGGRLILQEFEIRKTILEQMLKDHGFENKGTCIASWRAAKVLNYEDATHPCRSRKLDTAAEDVYVLRVFANAEEAAEVHARRQAEEAKRLKRIKCKKTTQLLTLTDESEVIESA